MAQSHPDQATFPIMSTLRTIILHHTPDPATMEADFPPPHYDWLVEIRHSEPGIRDVPTWRTPDRIDVFTPGESGTIQRIQDHRTDWLDQQDLVKLDHGRGLVRPVAHGRVRILSTTELEWLVEVDWESTGQVRYLIEQPAAAHGGRVERLQPLEDGS